MHLRNMLVVILPLLLNGIPIPIANEAYVVHIIKLNQRLRPQFSECINDTTSNDCENDDDDQNKEYQLKEEHAHEIQRRRNEAGLRNELPNAAISPQTKVHMRKEAIHQRPTCILLIAFKRMHEVLAQKVKPKAGEDVQ